MLLLLLLVIPVVGIRDQPLSSQFACVYNVHVYACTEVENWSFFRHVANLTDHLATCCPLMAYQLTQPYPGHILTGSGNMNFPDVE